jgi:hypothetical protein
MAEVLGMVHTCGRGLLQEWWWPVNPKLVFWPDGSTSLRNYGWLFMSDTNNPAFLCKFL